MLNINHLPVDCLLLIFSKFTLQEQITCLRTICQHWKTTIEKVLCRKRHSLKLFGRLKNITDHCLTTLVDNTFSDQLYKLSTEIGNFDDDFIIDSYIYCDDLEMYDFLGRLFGASVTTLSVHLCWDAPFTGLPIFLQSIHHQLTTLTISGAIDYPHNNFTTSLCKTIEKLPLLIRLDLLVIDLFLLDSKKSTNSTETDIPAASSIIELPVTLPRLEHFALCNYKGDLVDVLLQLTPSRCHSLRLDLPRDYDPVELVEDLVEECPELLENLLHFRFITA
ncbi:hypothetical protein TYRP_015299 [Tyrophagus putrescentiae]|nr:hypothetical protein TYRP_015299 [Tyrophagus putrescentiae]